MEKRKIVLLVGLFLGMFFASLDQTVVGTAMPRIVGQLDGMSLFAWIIITYMVAFTVTGPLAGKLADLFGRRIVYVVGVVIFVAGSALCGMSGNMTELIVFRGIQGLGGGIMLPIVITILGDIFSPQQRGKWQGLFMAVNGLASVVGPTIGGWLVDSVSWHWVFYVNLPFGILAVVFVFLGLAGETRAASKPSIDYVGAGSFVIAVVSLLLALSLGGKNFPFTSWRILGLFSIAAAALALFILVERRAREPILSLELFHVKAFVLPNVIGFITGAALFAGVSFLPLFMQGAVGMSATSSGNLMIPMMLALVVSSILGGRLAARVSFRALFAAGTLLIAAGFALLTTLSVSAPHLLAISYIGLLGLGLGLVLPTLNLVVQSAFSKERRGTATSATFFFRNIGGTIGVAVFGVVLNARATAVLQQSFLPKLLALTAATPAHALALAPIAAQAHSNPVGLFNELLNPALLHRLPPAVSGAILPLLRGAVAESVHLIFFVALFVALAAFVVSLSLGDLRLTRDTTRKGAQASPREVGEMAAERG